MGSHVVTPGNTSAMRTDKPPKLPVLISLIQNETVSVVERVMTVLPVTAAKACSGVAYLAAKVPTACVPSDGEEKK
jgi:hypothetical protein